MAETPIDIDDCDNEDFDWEAAVREIDHACMGAGASTSNHQDFSSAHPAESSARARPKLGGTSRQTTLDRFVDSYSKNKRDGDRCPKKPIPESPAVGGGDGDDFGRGDGDAGVCIDFEAAKTWIYPINIPLRDYQFAIAKTALFSNTLVALPTGLGKTLIAAVVMYNYFRWFPGGENPLNCTTISHESFSSRTAESGCCSSPKKCSSLQTPGTGLQSAVHSTCRNPVACQLDSERASLRNVPVETGSIQRNCSNKIESRKRKLSFQNATSAPATSDQSKHNFPFKQAGKASLDHQLDKTEIDAQLIFDDEFFQGLDLDAVEAQATTFLQCKSQISVGRVQMTAPNHNPETNGDPSMKFLSPPSFDLGI